MSTTPAVLCWICGNPANTREHRTKRSDLKLLFRPPTQRKPLHFHTDKERNRHVGSFDARRLKWRQPICGYCNSARTQPYDDAWSALIARLVAWPIPLKVGTVIRANRIFPYATIEMMRRVHLFFVKQAGCMFAEAGMTKETEGCSAAIMGGKAHPDIYLKFAVADKDIATMASGSDLHLEKTVDGNELRFAAWIYHVGPVAVFVMFAATGEKRDGLVGAWHPRQGTNRLVLAEL